MTRIVFHAFSAYVGSITGRTTCSFWPDDPASAPINWSAKALVGVDLARTPSAARAGTIAWTDVDTDDHLTNGGLNTIGPLFPGGHMIGACWLSETYLGKLAGKPPKPGHAHDHELKTIVYANDPTFGDKRFQGFHARIRATQQLSSGATLCQVELWNAGQGRHGAPAGLWWLDLDTVAHPIAADATQVGPKAAPEGALFLDTSLKNVYLAGAGTGPKLPPSYGYGD